MARTKLERTFRIKKRIPRGYCRIIENSKGCSRDVHCRGVCAKHHTYFLRWDLIEKYGVKQKFVYVENSTYKINKKAKSSRCRIIENGNVCTRKMHGRGLCNYHLVKLSRHDLHNKYGTASRKDPRTFAVKKKIKDGVCRMIENDKGCKGVSSSRGLCSKHYLRFLRDGGLNKFGKYYVKSK